MRPIFFILIFLFVFPLNVSGVENAKCPILQEKIRNSEFKKGETHDQYYERLNFSKEEIAKCKKLNITLLKNKMNKVKKMNKEREWISYISGGKSFFIIVILAGIFGFFRLLLKKK